MDDDGGEAMRYRRRPVTVTALRVGPDSLDEITAFTNGRVKPARLAGPGRSMVKGVTIQTLEQKIHVRYGEWLVRSPAGVLSVKSDAAFTAEYEPDND